jgi:hypothetical protein
MKLDISESKSMICNIHLSQVLSFSAFQTLPTSGDSLQYCLSVQQRRKDRIRTLLPDKNQLETWATQPSSMLLVMQSINTPAENDLLVRLVKLIQSSNYPILWALRFDDYQNRNITSCDVLRMLVIQALQVNPGASLNDSHPITMIHLREAADEDDWLKILSRALSGIAQVYLVLDSDLISHVTAQNRMTATKLLESFRTRITTTVVKIFVSSLSIDEVYAAKNWDTSCWEKLRLHVQYDQTRHKMRRKRTQRRRRQYR